ncbi:MAG: hypothetical protein QMD36_02230 [Candidatus Aenigmarchaeota archaeon]|nr:hypothetical protein [Candidatus Aenigmarchaeota archaeon]
MSLNGNTPAQEAGINLQLNGGNRWIELINLAVNSENNGQIEERKYPWELGIRRKEKRKYRRITYPKISYVVRVFSPDNREIKNPEGMKTEFKTYDKAVEFENSIKIYFQDTFSLFQKNVHSIIPMIRNI